MFQMKNARGWPTAISVQLSGVGDSIATLKRLLIGEESLVVEIWLALRYCLLHFCSRFDFKLRIAQRQIMLAFMDDC